MRSIRSLINKIPESFLIIINVVIWGFLISIAIGMSTMSDKILFLTFLALLWYAWETRCMKKEMVEQTQLEQKPIVDLFYRPTTPNHEQCLRLRNSGKGVAYNIGVETIKTDDDKTFEFYFEDPNLILTTGDEQTLKINAKYKSRQGGETWPGDPLNYFLDECVTKNTWENRDENNKSTINENQKTRLEVFYENAINRKFRRIFYIYDQIAKTDNKKKFEVEFKEEI